MFINVLITFLIWILRAFLNNKQQRWYLVIVRTADKPGYTLIFHNIPLRYQVTATERWLFFLSHILHVLHVGSFYRVDLTRLVNKRMCWVWFFSENEFFFPLNIFLFNQDACTCVPGPKKGANNSFPHTVHWKNSSYVSNFYSNMDKIPLIQQHSQYSSSIHWPLTILTIHWRMIMGPCTVNAFNLSNPTSTRSLKSLWTRLSGTQRSHLVVRHNTIFVHPLLVSMFPKGEIENPTSSFRRWFTPSYLPSLQAVCGAPRQQVGCGGCRGGGPPDV